MAIAFIAKLSVRSQIWQAIDKNLDFSYRTLATFNDLMYICHTILHLFFGLLPLLRDLVGSSVLGQHLQSKHVAVTGGVVR